jgi:hypothetical protein
MKNILGFDQFTNEEFGSGDAVACDGNCKKKKKTKTRIKKMTTPMSWRKDAMAEGCDCNKKKKRRIRKPLKLKDTYL